MIASPQRKARVPMADRPVTFRQRQILAVIRDHYLASGRPPTFREVMRGTGIGSTNGLASILTPLFKKGLLELPAEGPVRARHLIPTAKGMAGIDRVQVAGHQVLLQVHRPRLSLSPYDAFQLAHQLLAAVDVIENLPPSPREQQGDPHGA